MRADTKVRASHGLQQLLSDDPGQLLLHAVEQAQASAHHLRLPRVFKYLRRRPERIGWFHATDLLGECDRYLAARLLGYRFSRPLTPQTERILENGTFVHLRWQNVFLSLPRRFRVGVAVALEDWPILGEADVTVEHEDFGKIIVELKSANHARWSSHKRPEQGHQGQVNIYLGLSGPGWSGQVWYESKDNQDVKTFLVQHDADHYAGLRQRALSLVEQVLRGELPKACGDGTACEWDAKVANLQWDEERISVLRQEQERWQKKSG